MKVLIVDDNEAVVKGIRDHCVDRGWDCSVISFDTFDKSIDAYSPDTIVLDWKDDISGENKGNELLEKIWSSGFKPIIIFSGYADVITLEDKYQRSSLVKVQAKGDEEPVIEYLDMIVNFVSVITNLKDEFNTALIEALNSIEPISKTQCISEEIMKFIFAKRVSSYFDKECGDACPPPWIQYVCPPITTTLCVCDVIKKIPTDRNIPALAIGDPDEYRLILSPSCDIAQNHISNVLCAKCYPKSNFHGFTPSENPSDNQIKRIVSTLNTGYSNKYISLPGFPEVLPYLSVNLKQLEFIPLEKIALNSNSISLEHTYFRVASIDSPFREQIVWAYMITSCRPGMPNRDMNLWAKDLMMP